VRDPQCGRVYGWEESWSDWNRRTLSISGVREVVRKACRLYGLKPPAVKQHHHRQTTYSRFYFISFRPDHNNPAIALHESAHYICDSIFGDDLADHCPEWLGIYLWLLEEFEVAPRLALHSSIAALGLSWWPASAVSPSALRNRARTAPQAGTRSSRRHADRSR
jgi:hypothetical protein